MGPLWGPGAPDEAPRPEPSARGRWQGGARPSLGEILKDFLKEMAGYLALLGMALVAFVVVMVQSVGRAVMLDAHGLSAEGLALFFVPATLLGLAAGAYGRRWGGFIVLLSVPAAFFVVSGSGSSAGFPIDVALCAIPYALGWLLGWAIRVRRAEGQPPPTARGPLPH